MDFSPPNLGISVKREERFHRDMFMFEKRFSERWNRIMLAEYCSYLVRDPPTDVYYISVYQIGSKEKRVKKIYM